MLSMEGGNSFILLFWNLESEVHEHQCLPACAYIGIVYISTLNAATLLERDYIERLSEKALYYIHEHLQRVIV